MKLILLILSMVIALSIMAGCLEDKDDQTEVYSDIANAESEKQSLSENGFPLPTPRTQGEGVNHVNPNIASEKQIKKNKTSSRSEKKQASSGLPAANSYSDKTRSFQSEYQVIVENNLFRPLGWQKEVLKEIPPQTETVVVVEIPQERPAPTYNLTLTGIAQSGSEWIAILEDSNRKEGYFLHPGEKLKDSLVSEIFAGHIILVQGDTKAQFSLGESIQYDMSGQLLLNTVAKGEGVMFSSRSVPQKVEGDEDAQKSLIERMKAKRQKELGQK